MIDDCINNFGPAPRRLSLWNRLTYFRIPQPNWLVDNPSDRLTTLFQNLPVLFSEGIVVWGQIIQANRLMFEPGIHNCPGDLVYSLTDPRRVTPEQLHVVAVRLGQLKGTTPQHPDLAPIAKYLTNERIRVFGLPVPQRISPNLSCHISTTFFVRKHLPRNRICRSLMPVVVNPESPHVAMPLPARYWPKPLIDWWSE